MWQTDWAVTPAGWKQGGSTKAATSVNLTEIEAVYALHWSEHCIECVIPQCYSICPLYVSRRDRKCARFRNGILPNVAFQGLYDYGADVEFRRWGKLESRLWYGPSKLGTLRKVAVLDRALLPFVNFFAALLEPLNPGRKLNGAYYLFRDVALRILTRVRRAQRMEFDALLVEVWNPAENPVRIIIEAHEEELKFRASLALAPGHNLERIEFGAMNLDLRRRRGRLLVYPENDREVRLIFTWLDFVKFRLATPSPAKASPKAKKVKCVVWDLDDTLWKGVLVEDGAKGISPRPEALRLVKSLDDRGVIQSIASKNDYALAWPVVERLGLAEYFLYPAIHWGPKSASVRQIARELNLGLDAFAAIDDSPFERAEISKELPMVRTYSGLDVTTLLNRSEFDLPVTEETRRRREFYLAEAGRKRVAEAYSGSYEDFLKTCQMHCQVFTPKEHQDVDRCLELLGRSNQLNLTTHRYQRDEFVNLLTNPAAFSAALGCCDRFGEYGTVGFASIAFSNDVPLLTDFVLSCRVAQKRVENAWFRWLMTKLTEAGHARLQAWYVPTERNGVLLDTLQQVGFKEVSERDGRRLLELGLLTPPPAADIVAVEEVRVGTIPRCVSVSGTARP